MARKTEGTKVFIDATVLEMTDEIQPAGLSRTGWVNYLVQEGVKSMKRQAQ